MGGPALGSLSSYHLPNAFRFVPGGAGIDHAIFRDVDVSARLSPSHGQTTERDGIDAVEGVNDPTKSIESKNEQKPKNPPNAADRWEGSSRGMISPFLSLVYRR
uniref:Uncharacterized protein n=1 Tax=Odontella aurita TaxID=265563 RepID=A0A6U6G4J9_9STRA|mmetsp:Transcript_39451/g.118450  ORF Transcript_39451/g.118450 Transcript_39451/m.118450 type:complete len:104 (+) Transcript_39451:498-809(+)